MLVDYISPSRLPHVIVCMRSVTLIRGCKKSRHFNRNQRLWVVKATGAQAALVAGRFRGSGRYVKAWIKWTDNDPIVFKQIDVLPRFAERHQLMVN